MISNLQSGEGDGTITIQTEFPFYEPGNIVRGKIYINMKHSVHAKEIELTLKGKEKVHYIYFERRRSNNRTYEVACPRADRQCFLS